jgi:hypothetical protein
LANFFKPIHSKTAIIDALFAIIGYFEPWGQQLQRRGLQQSLPAILKNMESAHCNC